jgi:hypothetical protein
MVGKITRRTAYVGTVVAILLMAGGFALASSGILLNHGTQNGTGQNTAAAGPIVGVTYGGTELNVTNTQTVTLQSGLGSSASAVHLAAGVNAFCMTATCTDGDFSEQVTYAYTTSFAGAMLINLYVGTSAGSGQATLVVAQSSPASAGTILMVWDLGTSTVTVNSLTVTLYQCTGAGNTCP